MRTTGVLEARDINTPMLQRNQRQLAGAPATFYAVASTCALLLLSGCGTTDLSVQSSVPTPLIDALPLSMGVLYDAAFQDYSHTETVLDGPAWDIDLGDSNMRVFDELLSSSFQQIRKVDEIPLLGAGLDGFIKPVVEEYAFLTPRDAGVSFYSVSIRYRIELYDATGALVESWKVNAYGRTRSKMMKGKESLADATQVAMRDAVAALSIDLQKRPTVLALIPDHLSAEPAEEPL